MAITSRQFDQLSEMGVSLWQSRTRQNTVVSSQESYLPQNQQSLSLLTKQQLFGDILLSLNLSLGEVNAKNNHLDVGLFNWYFTPAVTEQNNSAAQGSTIYYAENKLISPSIDVIAQSSSLKKQLWNTIAKQLTL